MGLHTHQSLAYHHHPHHPPPPLPRHRFVTAGFDRFLRVWDTETGAVIQTVTNRKVPYCVKMYPLNDNLFISGMSDNRLYTFDTRSGT